MRASNEWAIEEICAVSPRYVVTAQVSTLVVEDAVEEVQWAADNGFKAVFLPTTPHPVHRTGIARNGNRSGRRPRRPAW